MQCWDKSNVVSILYHVLSRVQQFPISVIDKYNDTGADSVTLDEHLFLVIKVILLKVMDQRL